jgi:hypothetical protein
MGPHPMGPHPMGPHPHPMGPHLMGPHPMGTPPDGDATRWDPTDAQWLVLRLWQSTNAAATSLDGETALISASQRTLTKLRVHKPDASLSLGVLLGGGKAVFIREIADTSPLVGVAKVA